MRLGLLLIVAAGGLAHAAPHGAPPIMVEPSVLEDSASIPRVLFLDRCANNCTVLNTANDATTNNSTIPMGKTTYSLSAFAFGDTEWAAVVKCVKDVYSPYNVEVTDVKPDASTLYDKTFVAGLPQEIGQPPDVLGIAPLAMNCSVLSNNVAFAFANQHTPTDRVNNICWTVAQESAHMYGLDHEFQFTPDAASACNDPMTYRNDCGGEKFFRDRAAQCGENAVRDCKCKRATQNSDAILLGIFDAGTPTSTPPQVSIVIPAAGGITVQNGFAVQAMGSAQRGIAWMELVLNGHTWAKVPGTGFTTEGQQPFVYALQFPPTVPNGVIDIQVRGIDDIGVSTLSPVITVQKGAPCADATACLTGQSCSAGKCAWDAPTADVGATCTYNEFCISDTCLGGTCQQPCDPISTSVRTGCPASEVCAPLGPLNVCQPDAGGGGCCSTSRGGAAQAALGMFGLAMLLRRRRRC
jgi:MYXO-CTERM domain-containing protein